jgi:hypothetical protein
LHDAQRLDSSLVKTYMVEAHLPPTAPHDDVAKLLKGTCDQFTQAGARGRVSETEDEALFCAEFALKDGKEVHLFVDASHARFWLLHSMDNSRSTDWVIQRLTADYPAFDAAWLPMELLEKASTWGAFRGLSLDYDRRDLPDVDFESENAPVESLKMQLWANQAGRVLEILRGEQGFPNATTLSKVKVKFWLNGDEQAFALDDIKYNGKVTARGTSFESHIALTTDVYRRYRRSIETMEREYALGFVEADGHSELRGSVINFRFHRPIADLGKFCEHLFDCATPFRLWGVPIALTPQYYRVSAVDLHVGRALNLELTSEFIRLYLPRHGCGNSVVRLYTNLQHTYDSLVEAWAGDEQRLFQFD